VALRAVSLAAAVALLVALALVLTDSKPRQSGSNYVPEVAEVAHIHGDGERCQKGVLLPADTAQVRVLLGTYGKPAPAVTVDARVKGRLVTTGTLPAGGPQGHVDVPLRLVRNTTPGARVCVRLNGTGTTVLYGASRKVRLEWLRPGRDSWLDVLPVVARRFGYAKANPFGSALMWLAGLLLLVAWAMAGRLVARELRQ
jgi:hypothetical protein